MEINSKYFSLIEYDENAIVHFPNGLFGFDDYHHYIIVQFDENNDNLFCLQCIENNNLAFVMLKIDNYIPDYGKNVASTIDSIADLENFSIYNICTVQDNIIDSTVNLKCPIIIDLTSNAGHQVILENDAYTFKFPFSSLSEQKEA